MTSWTIAQRLFWDSFISRLWLREDEQRTQDPRQYIASLREAMEWLAEFVLADFDNRRPIVQVVENCVLHGLLGWQPYLLGQDQEAATTARILITSLLEPLSEHGLFDEFDPMFRRLIGYILDIDVQSQHIFEFTGPTGLAYNVVLTQAEVEIEACKLLKQLVAGQQPKQLLYLVPFRIGILIERTVNASITGAPDGQPLQINVPLHVPLLFLPLAADASLRKQLFTHFLSWFERIEPPLAKTMHTLLLGLVTENPAMAQKHLHDFYRAYLLSTHFQLTRDLVRGFDYLATLDLEELDALCGVVPVWPQGASFQQVIETLSMQGDALPPQKPSTWLLLQEPSRLAFAGARASESLLKRYAEEQRSMLLSHWIETAEADFDVLHSLVAGLGLLLHAAYSYPHLKVLVEETERPLQEWLTDHLLKILRYKAGDAGRHKALILEGEGETQLPGTAQSKSVRKHTPRDHAFLRRSIHAKLLRYAFRVVASPGHMQALGANKAQTQEHDLMGELLARGTLLSHRLSMLLDHTPLSLEQIEQQLTEVIASKGIPWSTFALQDQFNPEVYGPEPGRYDHLLAGTLAVFREISIDQSTAEGTSTVPSSILFWLTPQVKRALMTLVNRPENEAERQVRAARERSVPNRLMTFLDRTPQEYAAELLHFASPSLAQEEELLLSGRTKLLELLRQASDDVTIDITSLSQGAKRPDMVARVQVGGEAKHVLIEVKRSAEPRHLREAIGQLQSYVKRFSASYGLIIAPLISERGGKLCTESGVGYVDLQGNACIKFDGLFIRTVASRNGKRPRGRTKTLFAPISSRFVRALLTEPARLWQLQELAQATHMSLGQTHKVKQALLDQEFITVDRQRRLGVKEPGRLLDAWRDSYKYEQNRMLSLFSLEKILAIEEKIKLYCDRRKVRYAFTLFSGASKLAPFVRYSVVACYVIGDVEEFMQEVQLKPVESGANVLLLSPYDAGVLYGLQEAKGYKVVSPVQLYIDLYSYGGRGHEQADFLRDKLLGF